MTALMLSCMIAAAPVPKQYRPPLTFEVLWCGGLKCWEVRRGEKELWYFAYDAYTEEAARAHIADEDRKAADPLYRKLER